MLDGRVKTLHPKVHGGILARRDLPEHMAALEAHGIGPIDLVVVTLYPFEATVAKPGVTLEEAIENIDIGGPSMIRGAAKNHASVAVVTDPAQYAAVLEELRAHGGVALDDTRYRLAFEAFRRTAQYDAAIAAYLREPGAMGRRATRRPRRAAVSRRACTSRARSSGACATARTRTRRRPSTGSPVRRSGLSAAEQLHGPELGYNNLLDWSAALGLLLEFDDPAAVVIKHTNPCGVALGRHRGRGDPEGQGLRSGLDLRRHRGREPAARHGGRQGAVRHPARDPLRAGIRAGRARGAPANEEEVPRLPAAVRAAGLSGASATRRGA